MMYIPSSTLVAGCFSICFLALLQPINGRVINFSGDKNILSDQEYGLSWPFLIPTENRQVRTTKFPRIGRSPIDSEERSALFDFNTMPYHEDDNDNEDLTNDSHFVSQRSVLFPRIGKRAFHNIVWANARANPHRILDGEGRYQVTGYELNLHQFPRRHRGK